MAKDWPNRVVRWVVPFPSGGAMDAMTRSLAAELAEKFGTAFVVENQPGDVTP
jgi:tripartite-type tricarboxylate transporter receptor subunit TctC